MTKSSTTLIGKTYITLSSVDSTNDYLKRCLSNNAPIDEGTVILADTQFAGRGQQGNQWLAESVSNLTFSVLLKPSFLPVNEQFNLNKAICVGIITALTKYVGMGVTIKWPNDIYYGNGKLGGVLIENIVVGNRLRYAIVGIGININQVAFSIKGVNVLSLRNITGEVYDKMDILTELCSKLEEKYLLLNGDKSTKTFIDNLYSNRLLGLHEVRRFLIHGEEKRAIMRGVKQDGSIMLEIEAQLFSFGLKEISWLFD